MRITINPTFEWSDELQKYVLVSHDGQYDYDGPVELACGASKGMKEMNGELMKTAKGLSEDFSTVFSQDENILSSVMGVVNPILEAGASQFGMSPEQEAAERTRAMDSTAAAGTQVAQAVADAQAAKGGGNTYMPKGADEAINADIAEKTAQQNAEEQLGITQSGYEIGRENFWNANKVAMAAPGELQAPALGYGKEAVSADQASLDANAQLTADSRAWEKAVSPLIGGALADVAPAVDSAIPGNAGGMASDLVSGAGKALSMAAFAA